MAKKLTVEDLLGGIGESLTTTAGKISEDRRHSVESHLRIAIKTLGYKPRETTDAAGAITTTASDLLKQLNACVAETGDISEATHEHLRVHLLATHSNCAAEVTMKAAPALKEVPAAKTPKTETPKDTAPKDGAKK